MVKNPPSRAGDTGDAYLITELRRSPGGGNGNLLQYSCWEIPWTEGPGGLCPRSRKELDMTKHTHTKSLQMVTATTKLKDPCFLEGYYDKPRQHIKKQRHHFANNGPCIVKAVFSSSHVWM